MLASLTSEFLSDIFFEVASDEDRHLDLQSRIMQKKNGQSF